MENNKLIDIKKRINVVNEMIGEKLVEASSNQLHAIYADDNNELIVRYIKAKSVIYGLLVVGGAIVDGMTGFMITAVTGGLLESSCEINDRLFKGKISTSFSGLIKEYNENKQNKKECLEKSSEIVKECETLTKRLEELSDECMNLEYLNILGDQDQLVETPSYTENYEHTEGYSRTRKPKSINKRK